MDKKSEVLSLRLSADELERLRAAAETAKLTVSEYIRTQLSAYLNTLRCETCKTMEQVNMYWRQGSAVVCGPSVSGHVDDAARLCPACALSRFGVGFSASTAKGRVTE